MATGTEVNPQTVTYSYNSRRGLTGIPGRQQTFTYDTCPTGATGCVNAPGEMVQAAFGSGVGPDGLSFQYNYAYTPAGKVSSQTLVVKSSAYWSDMWGNPTSASLTSSYTYDNQGVLATLGFPVSTYPSGSAVFTYARDDMVRPVGLSDNATIPKTWATGVTYNPDGQMLFDGVQTWTYNNLMQVTSVTGTGMSMTYSYSPNQNNGQIISSVDAGTSPNERQGRPSPEQRRPNPKNVCNH